MSRPHKPRCIGHAPAATHFKPAGIPRSDLIERQLADDELEALRLVDFDGLSFDEAGARMGVSRGTIGRLVEAGRRTLVDAILHGHSLRVVDSERGEITNERPSCCSGKRQGRRGRAQRACSSTGTERISS